MVGRIPVMDVMPLVDLGRLPAKATAGEPLPVSATVFREGHDKLGAEVVLVAPDGTPRPPVRMTPVRRRPRPLRRLGHPRRRGRLDLRGARLVRPAGDVGARRRAEDPGRRRRGADVHRGRAAARRGARPTPTSTRTRRTSSPGRRPRRTTPTRPVEARLAALQSPELVAVLAAHPIRRLVTVEGPYPLYVDRRRALFSSWYEFFPRSEGATYDEKTDTVVERHPHARPRSGSTPWRRWAST